MSCPSESNVSSFLEGVLSSVDRGAVEAHLAGCSRCQELVACLVQLGSAQGSAEESSEDPRATGDRVGRYVLLHRIGAGAMGIVYAARDPELDRLVAIKLLHSDATASHRLLNEAQALARLAHPNVVTVFEVGTFRGEVFLAMELVDGVTLTRWLKGRTRDEILDVFIQAGRGLAAAHAAGIVHRDFKPDNVLVGKDGRVRVVDFGLARAGTMSPPPNLPQPNVAALDPPEALVRTAAVVGTPAYMAPEQHLNLRADARSDQFAFCVALHEALYGERPFVGKTPNELARHVVAGKLRRRSLWESSWNRRMGAILRRGLDSNPRGRHRSMVELVELLVAQRGTVRRGSVLSSSVGVAALVLLGLGGIAVTVARARLPRAPPTTINTVEPPITKAPNASPPPNAPKAPKSDGPSTKAGRPVIGPRHIARTTSPDGANPQLTGRAAPLLKASPSHQHLFDDPR